LVVTLVVVAAAVGGVGAGPGEAVLVGVELEADLDGPSVGIVGKAATRAPPVDAGVGPLPPATCPVSSTGWQATIITAMVSDPRNPVANLFLNAAVLPLESARPVFCRLMPWGEYRRFRAGAQPIDARRGRTHP